MNSAGVMVAPLRGLLVWMNARGRGGQVVNSSSAPHRKKVKEVCLFVLHVRPLTLHIRTPPQIFSPKQRPPQMYNISLASVSHRSCQIREESSVWDMDH